MNKKIRKFNLKPEMQKEQTKPGIKHPKHIRGFHQKDTGIQGTNDVSDVCQHKTKNTDMSSTSLKRK